MRYHRRVLVFFIVLVVGISLGATGSAQEIRASASHAGFLLAASSGHLIVQSDSVHQNATKTSKLSKAERSYEIKKEYIKKEKRKSMNDFIDS